MIPAIGTMIAAYIITRMLDLLTKDKKPVIKACGVITILVTLFSVADLLNAGSRVAGMNFQ